MRRICSALDSVSRMWPVPLQRGQVMWLPSREGRAQALAAHLEQAELRDRRELDARPVGAQRIAQARLDLAPVLRLFHVDEVDDDQAAEVAQAHLARDLVGRLEVGAGRGFLDVAAARRARRVDVDRDQRLGVVDDDRAARRQVHRARERGLDLVLDLEAREQRRVVAVALDLVRRLRHHMGHELLRLLVDVVGVDQDLADVGGEVVADRPDHERAIPGRSGTRPCPPWPRRRWRSRA